MSEQFLTPVRVEIEQAQTIFEETLRPQLPLFGAMAEELIHTPGKWLRPGFFLLSARTASSLRREHLQLAAAIEMAHTASLLHDDVLDGALVRRHHPTFRARWGDHAAVLFGDFLIAKAFALAAKSGLPDGAVFLAGIAESLSTGEALQDSLSKHPLCITTEGALKICEMKTAHFIAEVCRFGRTVDKPDDAADMLYSYGLHAGLAYQILDDITDVIGCEQQEGKTLRTDLFFARPTLVMAYLFETVPEEARKLFPPPDAQSVTRLAALIARVGAHVRAADEAKRHLCLAEEALMSARKTDALNGLEESFRSLINVLSNRCRVANMPHNAIPEEIR